MPSTKQLQITCSSCEAKQQINLLGCCLIFNCQKCLKEHSCQSILTILPFQIGTHLKQQKKCSRCNKAAQIKCNSCKNSKLFCNDCSKIIHQSKYSLHSLLKLQSNQSEAKSTIKRRQWDRDKSYTFDDSKSSKLSQTKENNLNGVYAFDSTEIKLDSKIGQIQYFQQIIIQRQGHSVNIIKGNFNKLRKELDVKQNEILGMLQQFYKQQKISIQKAANNLIVSKKSMLSLIKIGQKDPALAYLSKSKKACIAQQIKRVDKKIESLSGVEFRYSEAMVLAIAAQISTLKPFQKVRLNTMRVIDSTANIIQKSEKGDKSERLQRLQSRSVNKKAILGLVKKPSAVMSIANSRKNIYETSSPNKDSINNSVHSTQFNKKIKNVNIFQSDVSECLSPRNTKKIQMIGRLSPRTTKIGEICLSPRKIKKLQTQTAVYDSFYESSKLKECRSKPRISQNATFAGGINSPNKSYNKLK